MRLRAKHKPIVYVAAGAGVLALIYLATRKSAAQKQADALTAATGAGALPAGAGPGLGLNPAALGPGTPNANVNTMSSGNRFDIQAPDGHLVQYVAAAVRDTSTAPPTYRAYNLETGAFETVPATSIHAVTS